MTRRKLLGLLGASGTALRGQRAGMASRGVKPAPRGKPSGLPFHARFTDVAEKAGLRASVIYGPPGRVDYIIETMGAGIAFFDYDNDGWLDIFVLSGTRLDGAPPGTTNRLYSNNRDGTFTDVTERAGLIRTGWAYGVTVGDYNNDGFEDLFLTYWGQNVLYRNNGDGTFTDVTREAGLLRPQRRWSTGCTFLDYNRDGHLDLFVSNRLQLPRFRSQIGAADRTGPELQLGGHPCQLWSARAAAGDSLPLPQQRRWHVYREMTERQRNRELAASGNQSGIMQSNAGRISRDSELGLRFRRAPG